jgi:hypothetical protein
MSLALIESEIKQFLNGNEPGVLCITGAWGTGKTFAWNYFLLHAHAEDGIGLPHYAYVSLFGSNSLDELKYSIFENTISSRDIGKEPSLETLHTNALAVANRFTRKSLRFFQQLPWVKNHVAGLGPLWYMSVANTVVCIDDVERRGKNLTLRDVLGLATQLKEQKHCKVCLILNDEALGEIDEFRTYFEKVIDMQVIFAPSPQEAITIALDPGLPTTEEISRNCCSLGIANIRLIKKIERLVRRVMPILAPFHRKVTEQATGSLVLFAWSLYEPNRAPTPAFLRNRTLYILKEDREKFGPREAAWNSLLDTYGFLTMDDFDAALFEGLKKGYFDQAAIKAPAEELHRRLLRADAGERTKRAWDLYHDSFDDNQQQVLDAIREAFFADITHIDVVNLNGTISMFKELGRRDQALEMLEAYINAHRQNSTLLNLADHPFRDQVTDPDVQQALQRYAIATGAKNDVVAILRNIVENKGWHPDEIAILARAPVDEYRRIFKEHRGDALHGIINVCLKLREPGPEDDPSTIAEKAREALKMIGCESPINERRIAKYGIKAHKTPDN